MERRKGEKVIRGVRSWFGILACTRFMSKKSGDFNLIQERELQEVLSYSNLISVLKKLILLDLRAIQKGPVCGGEISEAELDSCFTVTHDLRMLTGRDLVIQNEVGIGATPDYGPIMLYLDRQADRLTLQHRKDRMLYD